MAARIWTQEQRKQQSMKIRLWQPWVQSTGATTKAGKAKASRNAYKGGYRKQLRNISKILREQSIELNEFRCI